jgi:hypothetical protein
MSGDTNMATLLRWASEYESPSSLPIEIENDTLKLIETVDMVESCIGREFEKDKAKFKSQYGSEPSSIEASKNILPFELYDSVRRQGFLDCIKKCIQSKVTSLEERYHLNLALGLWSGCLATAKTIALGTQTGKTNAEMRKNTITGIESIAASNKVFKKGVEIACIWKPDPKDISFDGVAANSSARKYESEWNKRQGIRSTKQCT